MSDVRTYAAEARSTQTFGRVLASARNHHVVVDGPVWNGCPGEAMTPGELFMASIATCAVELLEVIARAEEVPLEGSQVAIKGEVDPANPVRRDVTVFNRVDLRFDVRGVTQDQAEFLVERFKAR
ncbi:MAG: OsmC family protein [Actinomycetota bacterium]